MACNCFGTNPLVARRGSFLAITAVTEPSVGALALVAFAAAVAARSAQGGG